MRVYHYYSLNDYLLSKQENSNCFLFDFKLLQTYEREGHMMTIQPMLWGDAAVTHYRLMSHSGGLLLNPTPDQVLALIEMDKLHHTCRHFNIRLKLEVNPFLVQS